MPGDDPNDAAIERELGAALDRLPRHAAPAALKRRLAEMLGAAPAEVPAPASAPAPIRTGSVRGRQPPAWVAALVGVAVGAALVLVVERATAPRLASVPPPAFPDLVAEVVSDHLRVVSSAHPVDVESGGMHEVKPWFAGRLEFAPRVAFTGDGDFPLVGGSVGYVRDHKAALFLFKRRLHKITLLVFPPEGLAWPGEKVATAWRGFSVLLWRDGDLAYALVSDVNAQDLEQLARRIGGP